MDTDTDMEKVTGDLRHRRPLAHSGSHVMRRCKILCVFLTLVVFSAVMLANFAPEQTRTASDVELQRAEQRRVNLANRRKLLQEKMRASKEMGNVVRHGGTASTTDMEERTEEEVSADPETFTTEDNEDKRVIAVGKMHDNSDNQIPVNDQFGKLPTTDAPDDAANVLDGRQRGTDEENEKTKETQPGNRAANGNKLGEDGGHPLISRTTTSTLIVDASTELHTSTNTGNEEGNAANTESTTTAPSDEIPSNVSTSIISTITTTNVSTDTVESTSVPLTSTSIINNTTDTAETEGGETGHNTTTANPEQTEMNTEENRSNTTALVADNGITTKNTVSVELSTTVDDNETESPIPTTSTNSTESERVKEEEVVDTNATLEERVSESVDERKNVDTDNLNHSTTRSIVVDQNTTELERTFVAANSTAEEDGKVVTRDDVSATIEVNGKAEEEANPNETVQEVVTTSTEEDGKASVEADVNATIGTTEADGKTDAGTNGNVTTETDVKDIRETDGNVTTNEGGETSIEADVNVSTQEAVTTSTEEDAKITTEESVKDTAEGDVKTSVEANRTITVEADANFTAQEVTNTTTAEEDGKSSIEADLNMTTQEAVATSTEEDGNVTAQELVNTTTTEDGQAATEEKVNVTAQEDGTTSIEADGNVTSTTEEDAKVTIEEGANNTAVVNTTEELHSAVPTSTTDGAEDLSVNSTTNQPDSNVSSAPADCSTEVVFHHRIPMKFQQTIALDMIPLLSKETCDAALPAETPSNTAPTCLVGNEIQCMPMRACSVHSPGEMNDGNLTKQFEGRVGENPKPWLNVMHAGVTPRAIVLQANTVVNALKLQSLAGVVEKEMNVCELRKSQDPRATDPSFFRKLEDVCKSTGSTMENGTTEDGNKDGNLGQDDSALVVEIGSGNGNLLYSLCPPDPLRRMQCHGVDLTPRLVESARSYISHIALEEGVGASLPDGAATHVYSHGVFSLVSIDSVCRIIEESLRLARPRVGIVYHHMIFTGYTAQWPTRIHPFFFNDSRTAEEDGVATNNTEESEFHPTTNILRPCSQMLGVDLGKLVDTVEFVFDHSQEDTPLYTPKYRETSVYSVRFLRSSVPAKRVLHKTAAETSIDKAISLEVPYYQKLCAALLSNESTTEEAVEHGLTAAQQKALQIIHSEESTWASRVESMSRSVGKKKAGNTV